jgi:hypothetical protein
VGGHNTERFGLLLACSRKLKRVSHGSFDAETVWSIECLEEARFTALLLEEGLWGRRPGLLDRVQAEAEGIELGVDYMPCEINTDCNSLVEAARSVIPTKQSKRRRTDVADIKECVRVGSLLPLVHISGKLNPSDCISKYYNAGGTYTTRKRFSEVYTNGTYVPM